MAMENVTKTVIDCIKYEICGQQEKIVLPEVSARFLIEVYKLSKAHDVAHLVGDALNKSGVFENLPADLDENERAAIAKVKEKFDEQIFTAVYRYENINYELEQICKTLEEAKIPFIPLKGSVIRKYYPEPLMRTSCDIDVLVHENDIEKAMSFLVKKSGAACETKGSHDVGLFLNSVHIELHYSHIESDVVGKADRGIQTDFHYNDRFQNVRRKGVRSREIQDRKPDFAARKSHFTGNASSEKRIGKNLRKNGQIGRKVFRSDKRQ